MNRKTILKGLARLSEGTALKAAGKISLWGAYQPKELGREKQPRKERSEAYGFWFVAGSNH